MATTSKHCRSYWGSVSPKCARFFAVNCPPDGRQSSTISSWQPVCRWVSASGRSRTARQRAKTIRGYALQPMWAREDVCELFAQNVSPFAENLGQRYALFAANVGRVESCLWVRGITFVGHYK